MKLYSKDPIKFSDETEELIELCENCAHPEFKNVAGLINDMDECGDFQRTLNAKNWDVYSGNMYSSKYGRGSYLIKSRSNKTTGQVDLSIDKYVNNDFVRIYSLTYKANSGAFCFYDTKTKEKSKYAFKTRKTALAGKKIVGIKLIESENEEESEKK